MATVDDVRKLLETVEKIMKTAEENLCKFEEGWKEGTLRDLSTRLSNEQWKNEGQKKEWEEWKEELKEEKKELRWRRNDAWEQMKKLQNVLIDFGKETGNG